MPFFGYKFDEADLPNEMPPLGSSDWNFLTREVLKDYEWLLYQEKPARMMVVHPDDPEAVATVAMVERGDFFSETVECPKIVKFQYRGQTFTLLERPRPIRPHWP